MGLTVPSIKNKYNNIIKSNKTCSTVC